MGLSPSVIWLIIIIIMAVVELATNGLVSIWFVIGGIASLLLALVGAPIYLQIIAFILVSGVVLAIVRPIAVTYVNKKAAKTNIDAIVGRKLVAKTEIDNLKGTGKVDLDGSTWLAASSMDSVIIREGEEVVVVKVQGAKLIVQKEDLLS